MARVVGWTVGIGRERRRGGYVLIGPRMGLRVSVGIALLMRGGMKVRV